MSDTIDLDYLNSEEATVPKPRSGAVIASGSLSKDYFDPKNKSQGGKSIGQIEKLLVSSLTEPTPRIQKAPMTTVRVKSSYARDRVEVLAGGLLILKFDSNGVATMPTHQLSLLTEVQKYKPNRFFVLDQEVTPKEEPPKVVSESVVAKESVVEVEPKDVVSATQKSLIADSEITDKLPRKFKKKALVKQGNLKKGK